MGERLHGAPKKEERRDEGPPLQATVGWEERCTRARRLASKRGDWGERSSAIREHPQSKAGYEARPRGSLGARGSLGPRGSLGEAERHQVFPGWRPDRDRDRGRCPLLPRNLTSPEPGPAETPAAPRPAAEGHDRGRERLRRGRGQEAQFDP